MQRLHPNNLAELNPDVLQPSYDRSALKPGILHLGLGAFHRAHQAVFTERAIANAGGDWGIIGVSLRSTTVSEQLLPQGGLYSVLSEDGEGGTLQLVGAIRDVVVAPNEPGRVLAAIADPSIQIITLTITEKGYAIASGEAPLNPTSAIGVLALGLKQRLESGGAPLTVISCDNLSENSKVLCDLLSEYLQGNFPEVASWMEKEVSFPCSMVDRIVPAMSHEQKVRQAELLGLRDEGAVSTEPFSQWIIEDRFATDKPDWASAGVQFVQDIRPFEEMKLRLLNASHSAIAYTGLLAGLETVDAVMADPVLGPYIEALMLEDLAPALDVPAGFNVAAYREQLLVRYRNPRLQHRCAQIAMDGTEKIPQRWLPGLQQGNCPLLVNALAAWCHFVLRTELEIDDPRRDQLLALRQDSGALPERLNKVLSLAGLTPQNLTDYDKLAPMVLDKLQLIEEQGIRALLSP